MSADIDEDELMTRPNVQLMLLQAILASRNEVLEAQRSARGQKYEVNVKQRPTKQDLAIAKSEAWFQRQNDNRVNHRLLCMSDSKRIHTFHRAGKAGPMQSNRKASQSYLSTKSDDIPRFVIESQRILVQKVIVNPDRSQEDERSLIPVPVNLVPPMHESCQIVEINVSNVCVTDI
jgi:hypothetical protein